MGNLSGTWDLELTLTLRLNKTQHNDAQMSSDFKKYDEDIKEDIANSILSRYLPESMIIERGLKTDKQVEAAVKLVKNQDKFDTLLARARGSGGSGIVRERNLADSGGSGKDEDDGGLPKLSLNF